MNSKIVNIKSREVLYITSPPVFGEVRNLKVPLIDIRLCLQRGAEVEEVLGDRTVKLTLDNYDKNLSGVIEEVVEEKEEEVVEEKKEDEVIEEKEEEIVEEKKEDGSSNKLSKRNNRRKE